MSPLYLYAVVAQPPPGPLPAGLAGEPLRLVRCAEGLLAAVGEMASAPALEASALRGHDEAVRRLAGTASALLPARFGSTARDEGELREGLRPRVEALREALERVRGCEQMTLRFSMDAAEGGSGSAGEAPAAAPPAEGGPGRRYLAARRSAVRDPRDVPEVARVLDAVAPLLRGERLEGHRRPPLVASAYHLVPREGLEAYRRALSAAASRERRLRVAVSGPWPPYAFAPEAG